MGIRKATNPWGLDQQQIESLGALYRKNPNIILPREPQGEVVQPQIEGVQTNAQPTVEPTDQAPAMDPRDDYPIIKEDPQARALRQALQKDIQRGITEQDEAVKAAQAIPSQLDLSPLLALTDSMYGSKLQSGYNKPMRPEERQQLEVSLRKVAQAERQGLLNTLQKNPQDEYYKLLLKNQQTNERQGKRLKADLFSKFQSDKIATNAKEAIFGAGNARALLDSGTPVGDRGFTVALARAAGEKGPLSETDVNTWAGSPAVAQRVNRQLEKLSSGRLDEIDRQDMYKIIDILEKRQRGVLKGRVDYFATKVGPKVYDVDEETARMALSSELEAEPVPAASPGGFDANAAAAELQRRQKK